MSTLSAYSKISQITLPSNSTYAIIDVDGRALIAPKYQTGVAYEVNNYVLYTSDGKYDDLYKITADISAAENTGWAAITAVACTVGSELKAIRAILTTGIHYKGYTTTPLVDGSTVNPIIINGASYTAVVGDMVIYNSNVYEEATVTASTFATDGTFTDSADGYLYTKSGSTYTKVISGSYDSNETYYLVDRIEGLEFVYDGTYWNEFGSTGTLKAMAFADTASGSSSVSVSGTAAAQTFTGTAATLSGNVTGTDVTMTVTSGNKTSITPFATGGSFTQGVDTFNAGSFPTLSAGTAGHTYTVSNEVLTIGAGTAASLTAGVLPSFSQGSDTFVAATGGTAIDALTSLPTPSVTQGSVSIEYTPAGSNSSSSVSANGSVSITVTPDI